MRITRDYIILSTKGPPGKLRKSPGVCKIRGAGSPRNWDIRPGYGIDGATSVFTGNSLSRFSVDIFLWEDSQWEEWDDFATILVRPTPATRAKSLSIVHPLLIQKPIQITSVVVEDVSQFEYNDSLDLWACEIKFMQFKKPRPILVKPTAAIPAATQAPPTAKDAAEEKMQALFKELDAL